MLAVGDRMTLHDEVLKRVAEIAEIARRYGVIEIAVFGSALRLEASQAHDLDLLVTLAPDAPGLIAFERLRRELSLALGKQVDLVSSNGLKSAIRDEVLRDARVLYAA